MRALALRLFVGLGLDRPLSFLMKDSAVILMYHGFRAAGATSDPLDYYGDKLPADRFAAQLRWLKANRTVLPPRELVERLVSGRPLPPYATAITIDDGYRSVFEHAYPALRGEGLPAALFVATQFVDERVPLWVDRVHWAHARSPRGLGDARARGRLAHAVSERLKKAAAAERRAAVDRLETELEAKLSLDAAPASFQPATWEQLRAMSDSGLVEIGSHSHTHPVLARCPPEEIETELNESKRLIETKLGRPCPLFCYPNGDTGDFDATTTRLLQAAGYSCGLTTVPGFVKPGDDAFALRRFGTSDDDSLDAFALTFSVGRHVKRRLKAALGAA